MAQDEQRRLEIEAAVGSAMSKWGSLEHMLGTIFRIALGYPNHGPDWALPQQILTLQTSYRTQMKMIDLAVKHRFRDRTDVLEIWKKILGRVDLLKEKRNALAHGSILYRSGPDYYAVLPPFHSAHARRPNNGELRIEDIRKLERRLDREWLEVTDLANLCETGIPISALLQDLDRPNE